MEKAIAKLTKENHLNTLLQGLPLLTTLFGINCLVIHYFMEGIDTGAFAMSLGSMLIAFVLGLFVYDKYHHILLYEKHLLIYFQPLKMARKIEYTDIEAIITPENATEFSSMLIKLKNRDTISLHFVDYPHHVKEILYELMKLSHKDESKDAA